MGLVFKMEYLVDCVIVLLKYNNVDIYRRCIFIFLKDYYNEGELFFDVFIFNSVLVIR